MLILTRKFINGTTVFINVLVTFQDVTGNEFIQLMHVLGATRLSETATGQRELTDIIAEQAELDHPFDPRDESQIDRIIHCTHCAIPYFSVRKSLFYH